MDKLTLAKQMRKGIEIFMAAADVTDTEALELKGLHKSWKELTEMDGGQGYLAKKAGYRFRYGDDLYKTVNDNQRIAAQWIPGEGTSAIYTRIDEGHSGTADDPIPVPEDVTTNAFTYETGKYYDESGTIYQCKRQGEGDGVEHSFTYKPSQLVGQYFVLVEDPENESA